MNTKTKTPRKTKTPNAKVGEFNEADFLRSVTGFVETLQIGKVHTLRTTTLRLPDPLPPIQGEQIRALRKKLGMSQAVFALHLNIPPRTVISWENHQRVPTGSALKVLDLMDKHPGIFISYAASPEETAKVAWVVEQVSRVATGKRKVGLEDSI